MPSEPDGTCKTLIQPCGLANRCLAFTSVKLPLLEYLRQVLIEKMVERDVCLWL